MKDIQWIFLSFLYHDIWFQTYNTYLQHANKLFAYTEWTSNIRYFKVFYIVQKDCFTWHYFSQSDTSSVSDLPGVSHTIMFQHIYKYYFKNICVCNRKLVIKQPRLGWQKGCFIIVFKVINQELNYSKCILLH